mgnify:CR=1 FL=1
MTPTHYSDLVESESIYLTVEEITVTDMTLMSVPVNQLYNF